MADANPQTLKYADVYNTAFKFYFAQFATYFGIVAVVYTPSILFDFAFVRGTSASAEAATMAGVSALLSFVTSFIATGAVTYAVLRQLRGQESTMGRSLSVGLKRILGVAVLSFLISFFTGLGTMLCLIPGLIVMAMNAVAVPAYIAENLGIRQALVRSAALTKGNRRAVVNALVLMGLTILLISLVVIGGGSLLPVEIRAGTVKALNTLYAAPYAIMGSVLYHQLRVAKEGVDTQKLSAVFD